MKLKTTFAAISASAALVAATLVPASSAAAVEPTATPKITTLTVGAVPSLDLGLLLLAQKKGWLKAAGLKVNIVPVDSGPNVVTGVVAGQYDIGSTAYAPPLLAVGNGAALRYVSNISTVGAAGTNGGTLVRKDSGITSWKDLAGKKIASNAPRSLFSLTIPAAIKKAGGDPSGIQIVPLPFSEIPKAVANGQVDAGVALEPFLSAGLAEYSNIQDLGDSIASVLPKGSGSGLYFTSSATAVAKKAAIRAFQKVIAKTVLFANKNLSQVKIAGAAQAGLTKKQALALTLNKYSVAFKPADTFDLINLMVKFNWLQEAPSLGGFLKKI